jgi:ADP-ribose pyrophosphatase YjhB (NUDIX family)
MEHKFNIRVYGICIQNGHLLMNEELILGRTVYKLPGGGLDWGEGTLDCLKREWKEELNMDIEVKDHFYTTDFFQKSAFDQTQVISIYYFVEGKVPEPIINHVANERTYWVPLHLINEDTFTLAIDKVVGGLLFKWLQH